MTITTILVLVWLHFFADFICQTDTMAVNKSTSDKWLTIHCAVYSIPFLIFYTPAFAAITFATHFVTDYVSSRATTKLWQEKKRHWFFVVIGLDQAIHMTTLFLTYKALF